MVGAIEIGGLSVRIAPKIGVRQLLSLACYATGKIKLQASEFDFPRHSALPDALALAFGVAAGRAFSRGLLHGYRIEEDALPAVRGRVRFDDQIRRRFGIPLPVEVRYDEFTADILLNRLVKAAAHRLGRLGLRSREARRGIAWVAESLSEVSLATFPRGAVPEVRFDRLNEHYRSVVALARLVLRHGAFEAGRGKVRASGFLMDMNQVFQEFVTVALRERLGVTERAFGEHFIGSLDREGRVLLQPVRPLAAEQLQGLGLRGRRERERRQVRQPPVAADLIDCPVVEFLLRGPWCCSSFSHSFGWVTRRKSTTSVGIRQIPRS